MKAFSENRKNLFSPALCNDDYEYLTSYKKEFRDSQTQNKLASEP